VVKVEYYDRGYDAVAQVSWAGASASPPPQPAPTPASCAGGQFAADYFGNTTLSGSPAVSRCDASIAYDWGSGAPAAGVPADGFSARWSGSFDFTAGDTTFTARSDDGIRVWVDGGLLIDQWNDHGATTYTARRTLAAGAHTVKVEYYDNGYDAVAQVAWTTSAAAAIAPTAASTTTPSTAAAAGPTSPTSTTTTAPTTTATAPTAATPPTASTSPPRETTTATTPTQTGAAPTRP
jgi:hypothetical protein